jgi:hypothetical protein
MVPEVGLDPISMLELPLKFPLKKLFSIFPSNLYSAVPVTAL